MLKLSIIVPFYNVEPFIEQCIRSLYTQDLPTDEYEVICVDDCSPDGSRVIVEKLQTEYPTLQLICHERNKRQGGARNTGLRAAKGEYIWFVDSDDYLVDNVLQQLTEEAITSGVDILQFAFAKHKGEQIVYHDHTIVNPDIADQDIHNGRDFFFSGDGQWHRKYVTAWQKLYRRAFLTDNNIYFQENIMYEDNDYAMRTFFLAKTVKYLPLVAYVYRQNADSVTRTRISAQKILYLFQNCRYLGQSYTFFASDKRFARAIQQYIQNTVYRIIHSMQYLSDSERSSIRHEVSLSTYVLLYKNISTRSLVDLIDALYFQPSKHH